MRAALLGKPLGHSYSKVIHEALGYGYDLVEVEPENLKNILLSEKYGGFNITIPYKKTVMQYLDALDETALAIGSVNTVKKWDGILTGYNTDILGLEYLLKANGISLCGQTVMILGTGGTSLTAQAACKRARAKEVIVVGRSSPVNYQNCVERKDVTVIINATPVGMYPEEMACPIDVDAFPNLTGVADVIYNPLNTVLVTNARNKKIPAVGGLQMLVAQAVYASQIFTGEEADDCLIEKLVKKVRAKECGIVFVGMPGSGKSTLAKLLAKSTGKELVDTDKLVEKLAGITIPAIFDKHGEQYFRKLEQYAVQIAVEKRNAIIATGGGAILCKANRDLLRSNAVCLHIKRDIKKLTSKGRPLSSSADKIKELEQFRMPIYCEIADFTIDNNAAIDGALSQIKEILG